MEHEIETVYYNYWGRTRLNHMIDMCERLPDLFIERNIDAISIESNNKSFLDYYREHYKIKGDKYCDMWLRGMLADYVKRCSRRDNDAPYHRRYYEDWLSNTRWIANEFPELIKWCDEYEQWLPNDDTQPQQSVNVPGDHKRMEWCDLSELREAANEYLSLLQTYDFVSFKGDDVHKTISRLRNAIANVDLESVGDVLKRYNVNQTKIIYECECLDRILLETINVMGNNLPKIKKIDPDVAKMFQFLNRFYDILLFEIEDSVLSRCTTDPTKGDVDAGERLKSYLNGDYGDMEFRWFYKQFVECYDIDEDYKPNDLKPGDFEDMLCYANIRRLKYLISICPDDEIKTIMNERVEKFQHEIDTRNNAVTFDTPEPPGNEQAAQPPLPPSAEANATDDAQPSPKVDADRLGSFFNAKFKGAGNNPDRIKDLVNDIEKIKVTKELAMIAVMIYDCRQYFIRRSSTFAAWLREFFDIIGRDCPKDTHKNKYKPDERIERLFYYLK